MKKLLLITTLLTASTFAMAKGGFHDGNGSHGKAYSQQGFYDESKVVKSVSEALNASDDTPVALTGSIIKQIDNDEFLFKDSTGEVQIEVSKRAWNGQTIAPQDTIEIRGKVDKEWNRTEIDVKQIIKK